MKHCLWECQFCITLLQDYNMIQKKGCLKSSWVGWFIVSPAKLHRATVNLYTVKLQCTKSCLLTLFYPLCNMSPPEIHIVCPNVDLLVQFRSDPVLSAVKDLFLELQLDMFSRPLQQHYSKGYRMKKKIQIRTFSYIFMLYFLTSSILFMCAEQY